MAASGGRTRLYTCSSLKKRALLEHMIVEGALCIQASCVVLVEASRAPREGEEEILLMRRGRTAEEALSDGCKKVPQSNGRCGIGID